MHIILRIPKRGALAWHGVLADALRERRHEVRIAWADSSPPPGLAPLLLALESLAFGKPALSRRLTASERRALPPSEGRGCDLILDLAAPSSSQAQATKISVIEATFDGQAGASALMGALLAGRAPVMVVQRHHDGRPLARSYPSIDDREVLVRALDGACARVLSLFVRAVEREAGGGEAEAWSEPPPVHAPASADTAAVIRFTAREFTAKLQRRIRKRRRAALWSLAGRRTSGSPSPDNGLPSLAAGAFVPLTTGTDAYADPLVHEREGEAVLFAERQPLSTGKGVLVCARQLADGEWGPFETCLERPYHLSYPFVFDYAGETWLMPETGAAGTLELYRASDYPLGWTLDRVLMQDVHLADATLVEWQGRWWLFAARGDFGGSLMDELVAFHAPSPLGPWTPHSLNPLKSDVRSARPAGRFITQGGRLYRPAQDCEAGYGTGLVYCEVTALTPTTFAERVIEKWEGAAFGADGVHSFARGGGWEIVDLKHADF